MVLMSSMVATSLPRAFPIFAGQHNKKSVCEGGQTEFEVVEGHANVSHMSSL